MADPTGPDARAALGDGWKAAADRERNSAMKPRLQARALYWYEQAIGGFTRLGRPRGE